MMQTLYQMRAPVSAQTNQEIATIKARLQQTLQLMRERKDVIDVESARVICASVHTIIDSVRVQVEHVSVDAPPTTFIPSKGV